MHIIMYFRAESLNRLSPFVREPRLDTRTRLKQASLAELKEVIQAYPRAVTS